MRLMRGVAPGLTAAALVGVYALAVRPRLLRWGATDDELREPFPDAGIVPEGKRSATMAVDIGAPPEQVWPWLVQMGTDRAGWYSWDRLDNFGHASAEHLHPEWQQISVGDRFGAAPQVDEWWEVAAVDPNRFLSLRMTLDLRGRPFDSRKERPRAYTDSTWSFLLKSKPEGGTRLVVSGYWALQPRWLQPIVSVAVLEPSHWIMQTRQFANLKRLASEHSEGSPGSDSSETTPDLGEVART